MSDEIPQDPDQQPHEAFLARRAAASAVPGRGRAPRISVVGQAEPETRTLAPTRGPESYYGRR